MKPVIGVTCDFDLHEHRSQVFSGYYESIIHAGGIPLLIPCSEGLSAEELFDKFDGLLLTGGQDIDPYLYGEEPHPDIGSVYTARDRLEIDLCRKAAEADMPVLGICKGLQVMNVAMGGTLIQDIRSALGEKALCHSQKAPGFLSIHDIHISRGSKLGSIFNSETLRVNSFHHQAIKDTGGPLVITARAGDGIAEAAESSVHRFFVGVQWHPERMISKAPEMLKLFEALVREAGRLR
ncbi:MAG TPA: gamma-glutamyl-gamma-aminobutyrate hydrolase family protein [Candidatus Atribacteria bacterium]|nr:gamma-glutamyl-gamma-aminobutyrate hydrolase family protein [Candidatus Atribacteria bacterium]